MRALTFTQMHGLGNDFLVVDGRQAFVTAEAAARLCDRRRGIGADGILTLLPPSAPGAAARMHVFNADGSVAEMCGNGLRCVVRHLLEASGDAARRVVIETGAGLRDGELAGPPGRVRVGMGVARLVEPRIELELLGQRFAGVVVSMGNPHLVLGPWDPDQLRGLAERFGPGLERHPRFPERVNIGFFAPTGDAGLRLVVFERGSGITEACGTGAAAAAVVARRARLVAPDRPVTVHLPGGALAVEIDGAVDAPGPELGAVRITGEAVVVFTGTVALGAGEVQPAPEGAAW